MLRPLFRVMLKHGIVTGHLLNFSHGYLASFITNCNDGTFIYIINSFYDSSGTPESELINEILAGHSPKKVIVVIDINIINIKVCFHAMH